MKWLFSFLTLALMACPAFADVTVTGTGEARVEPDQGQVSFTITATTDNVKSAVDKVSAETKKVLSKMKELKIEDKYIQTNNLSVQPRYQYQQNNAEPRFLGYQASNTMTITCMDISKTGDIAALATDSDMCRLNRLSFSMSDDLRAKVMNEARQSALKNAMKKASMYSKQAGVKLGKMKTFREDDNYYGRPTAVYSSERAGLQSAAMDRSIDVSGGEIRISVNVQAVFPILTGN